MTIELYRPANGTEGDWFHSRFCDRCAKDTESRPCRILSRTLAHSIDEPEYPKQWRYVDGKPTCTAFKLAEKRQRKAPVDPRQEVLL